MSNQHSGDQCVWIRSSSIRRGISDIITITMKVESLLINYTLEKQQNIELIEPQKKFEL